MSTTMLVDGQNLFMRAVFAAKGSAMTSHGVWTGPMTIFANTLAKHVRMEKPSRLVVCWDGGTSKYRRDRLASYKAKRKDVPTEEQDTQDTAYNLVLQFCAYSNVQTVRREGVEADDLIANAWRQYRAGESKIVILSSDKDFMQLLGKTPHGVLTEQVRLSSAGTETDRWDEQRFAKEYDYLPKDWPLLTALAGDTGDGVPGISGIGPVKAKKLLDAANWNWPTLLNRLSATDRKTAEDSRFCVDLRDPAQLVSVSVPAWRPVTPDSSLSWSSMMDFLNAWDLDQMKTRMLTGGFWSDVTQSDIGRPVTLRR